MGWGIATRHYVTMMQAAGRSPRTIRLHRHYLYQLWDLRSDPWRVTGVDLMGVLSRGSWGAETRRSARSVYRGFYRWGVDAGWTETNPALVLPAVRVNAGVPRPTPERYAQAAMGSADERTAFAAMLAGYCGLRAGEIAVLHESDYDAGSSRLLIHGKGAKERTVPVVQPDLLARLDAVQGWGFPGRTDGHLSPGHVSVILSRALPGRWTGHTLRHRAGTRAFNGTHDLLAVARMLGHSRTETTQRYVQLDDDALLGVMNAAAA